ncbi:MAG: TIGR00730 family Rossman fold protein [Patescibacteria group bacterium]
MIKNIAVYCSSSDVLSSQYFTAAKETGTAIGANMYSLVYGGGNTGLMGSVAEYTQKANGTVVAVIPKAMEVLGLAYSTAEELIVTSDMYERKKIMSDRADAFITLAGGFGTLEEVLEVITQKQLHLHSKPIVFVNTNKFYDKLIEMFEVLFKEKTAKELYRDLYYVTATVEDAFEYIKKYTPPELPTKWFKDTGENIAEASPI